MSPQILTKSATALVAFATLTSVALPVQASERAGRVYTSMAVPHSDLDLTTETGQKDLDNRIRKAANLVCAPSPTRGPIDVLDHQMCLDSAIKQGGKAMKLAIARAQNPERVAQNSPSASKPMVGN